MTPEELYAILNPAQEKKGYCFNPDYQWCLDVLAGTLTNKARYGYGSCPCRLAVGERERDREIICPCVFRDEDVRKYDACYCRLYMSPEGAAGQRPVPESIPDRWFRK